MVPSRNIKRFETGGLAPLSNYGRTIDASQNSMLMARETLRPLIKIPQSGSSWRGDERYFHLGEEGPSGLANLSPAWFQQGRDVSASKHRLYFSAAHPKSGNVSGISTGFCELP
jgi:hypothetical protein